MRRALSVLAIAAFAIALPTAAGAGGSSLRFDREWYAVGDVAVATGVISPTNAPERGWIEHGPYRAYLVGREHYEAVHAAGWPSHAAARAAVVAEGVALGTLRFGPPPPGFAGATVTLEFVVPELPTGEYAVTHCNVDCALEFGDLMDPRLHIADPAFPPPPSTSAAAPTSTLPAPTTAPAATESQPIEVRRASASAGASDDGRDPRALGGVLAIVVLAAGGTLLAVRRNRRPI